MAIEQEGVAGAQDVLHLLKRALVQKQVVTLASAYGSRPGEARELTVLSIDVAADSVTVLDIPISAGTRPFPKQYRLSRVLWVQCADGERADNVVTARYYAAFKARLQDRDDEISSIRAGAQVTNSQLSGVATLQDPDERQPDSWQLVLPNLQHRLGTTTILLRRPEDQQPVCNALDFLARGSEGKVWEVIEVLILAKVSWPSWWRFRTKLFAEGLALRGTSARLRDSTVARNAHGAVGYDDYMAHLGLYARSSLRPVAYEREGLALNRVRLFEADQLDLSVIFRLAETVPGRALGAYLTSATERSQMSSLPCEPITATELQQLLEARLVFPANEAPIQLLLQRLRASGLSAPLRARGVRLGASGLAAYRAYYSDHMDTAFERSLRDSPHLQNQFVFMPPKPWDWEALQDFRTCYLEMLRELARWLRGEAVQCARFA